MIAPIELPKTIIINFIKFWILKLRSKNGKSAMQWRNPHNINVITEKTVIICFLLETAIYMHIPHKIPLSYKDHAL